MDEVEELRVRGLEEDGVQLGGLEVNAEGRHEAEEVVFKRFGEGVGNAVPNLLGERFDEDEEVSEVEEIVSGHFGSRVDDAVIPELLEYEIGVDNAVCPNLLGELAAGPAWPERGPRLGERLTDVERELDEGLDLASMMFLSASAPSHEFAGHDGELF